MHHHETNSARKIVIAVDSLTPTMIRTPYVNSKVDKQAVNISFPKSQETFENFNLRRTTSEKTSDLIQNRKFEGFKIEIEPVLRDDESKLTSIISMSSKKRSNHSVTFSRTNSKSLCPSDYSPISRSLIDKHTQKEELAFPVKLIPASELAQKFPPVVK